MAASLLGLGLVLSGTSALAQEKAPPPAAPAWVVVPVDRSTSAAKAKAPEAPRGPEIPNQEPNSGPAVNWRSSQGANAPPIPWVVPSTPAAFSTTPPSLPKGMTPFAGSPSTPKREALPPAASGSDAQQVLLQVQPQPPPAPVKAPTEENAEVQIQLTPPGTDRLFRRESERDLQERMRQEARGRRPLDRIEFPPEPVLSTEKYAGRSFPPARETVEPNYVCYQRLYFEQLNSERYGWDLGFFQPLLATGKFYWDLVALPYHVGTAPCRHYDCNSGYCLPGDPVPLLLYPPDISVTGAILEAGTIFGLYAIFPG